MKEHIPLGFDDESPLAATPLTFWEKVAGWAILALGALVLLTILIGAPLGLMKLGAYWFCHCP